MKKGKTVCWVLLLLGLVGQAAFAINPFIRNIYSADPAGLVFNGRCYVYVGHDEGSTGYVMRDWHCYSSADMVNWTDHGTVLAVSAFSWAKADAWASQVVYKNGKFFYYVCCEHRTIPGKALGVAVANSPIGPFTDARGSALVTNNQTTQTSIAWDDIDPTVLVDDDGQAYLYWGNTVCKWARLNSDMISIIGSIGTVSLPSFTEAPYLSKHNGIYYLSYAYGWPEKIAYATSSSPTGPWSYRGVINELISGCGTNHQSLIDFNGQSYFIYHSAGLSGGGDYKRSVCVDYLYYNADGTIRPVVMTAAGITGTTSGPTRTATLSTRTSTSISRTPTRTVTASTRTATAAGVLQAGAVYTITARYSGKLVEVANASTAAGGVVQQWPANGHNCQKWRLEDAGSGYYCLVNVNSGLLMEVANASTANSATIQQWPANGHYCQQWSIRDAGGGYFCIVNRNSSKYADVNGNSTANGAKLIQYTATGGANQQFQFVRQ